MGWTNSVLIFHDDVTHILQPEIPDMTIPFIDNVPIRGPLTQYELPNRGFEMHPNNPSIQQFVWEHFQGLNWVFQWIKYSGGTFSGHKATLCTAEITVVSHHCMYEGGLPDESRVESIMKWGPYWDLSDVQAFLGTIGVVQIFIRNFAHRAHALTMLTRKDCPFVFGPDQIAAQDNLWLALLELPALWPIDYSLAANVILAVNTSQIAPKLELYGLFRALRSLKIASINWWIVSILTFHFTLVHVPGTSHGPDSLSRQLPQPSDRPEPKDDFDDWIDNLYGFLHQINNMFPTSISTSTTAIFTSSLIGDLPTNTESDDEGPTIDYSDILRLQKALEAKEHLWLFFITADKLWRKDSHGRHKIVAAPSSQITILTAAHNNIAHRGFYAMTALIAERFWWPHMRQDISWFVWTCYLCQIRQTRNILIPPTVAMPAPLFAKMYMDTMHMLTTEIVSNNGPAFIKALDQLAKKYHVWHIRISGYNSRANGITEQPHFDVRQALFKAVDGDQAKWNLTGTHPLLPLDIAKATYLLPPLTTTLSTTDLIARRAIALQKR
ncbi:hypothetical protein HETIRDRAFT_455614 [Heterobasidion irregulare TC 32-1]|uniref:Integrase zinc-binding domain-containing protein n=1 Tax=Heterobasidion irregulare (strain TC 32-1) TaxID=747525 RepID=W4JR06_HETIT|nr:uncharacterized protein HETIRDRAFT_455614 [Heterobasidion irregulare TC 32-1]ETW76002.1 hypothetical protein HETIRDRAFT_455614 [Heterobasidion irregulare TC 32-1]